VLSAIKSHHVGALGIAQPYKLPEGKYMTIARSFLGAAVSVLALAGTAAYADTTPVNHSQPHVVRYKDLDLDQPRDVARLFNRISTAADGVCGPRSFGGYPKTADYKSCYSDAIARAVAHIDRPLVTAYFQQHGSDSASGRLTIAQQ
jgi:UrcA family protein